MIACWVLSVPVPRALVGVVPCGEFFSLDSASHFLFRSFLLVRPCSCPSSLRSWALSRVPALLFSLSGRFPAVLLSSHPFPIPSLLAPFGVLSSLPFLHGLICCVNFVFPVLSSVLPPTRSHLLVFALACWPSPSLFRPSRLFSCGLLFPLLSWCPFSASICVPWLLPCSACPVPPVCIARCSLGARRPGPCFLAAPPSPSSRSYFRFCRPWCPRPACCSVSPTVLLRLFCSRGRLLSLRGVVPLVLWCSVFRWRWFRWFVWSSHAAPFLGRLRHAVCCRLHSLAHVCPVRLHLPRG